ncbi:phosphoribosylformylglycinamidine synthase subunit PurL [Micrococcoides hystricis]|uniref:Phosphoribosylformylglycinamidine synthase subunit PurL n=1 Tax=Micrococcoides hystricis TaxID=1572761 RepID=A0ABV6PAN6_9MICC
MTDTPEFNIDTVDNAAGTPNESQPWAELGLKENEYEEIRKILGRRPTAGELAMYSVMWSEHCSYKSSKVHLRQFGDKVTEKMKENMLVGIGQNAGVTDLGDGWAVTFKVESHNSPSYIEPFQGAATGIGGIVRDIISMGARPIAVLDALRLGKIDHPDTKRVLHGAVAGLSHYGNTLGVPGIGGELVFDSSYQGNPLVNAMAIGVMRHEDIHLANASGVGNKVLLYGARTGADGIGGASVLASESFDDSKEVERPTVQAGDPFTEKSLIEATLELFSNDLVEGIQDLGAAGISCATSELASNGEGGMHIELTNVICRDEGMTPGEILMSESQERMMAVIPPQNVDKVEGILNKWDVEYAWLGEVTDTGRLIIDWDGETIVDVDPRTVAHDGPVYDRPYQRPAFQDELQANTFRSAVTDLPSTGDELKAATLDLLGSANLCSKKWVTDQFDSRVQGNTTMSAPDDAGVVRVDENTNMGVAGTMDCNARYVYLDPYHGSQLALAESYRNIATAGAVPVAVSDCLNYGSPENPETMWQFAESIRGLADGCQELEVPVTGGNVSLYNQTNGVDIFPTPVIGVLGRFDDVTRRTESGWTADQDGAAIYLMGTTADELDGSEYANLRDHLGGLPPKVDLKKEVLLGDLLINASRDGMIDAAHDISEGGLAVTLAEMALRYGVGARITLEEVAERDGIDMFTLLFSESQARAVVVVPRSEEVRFNDMCTARNFPVARIGVVDAQANALQIQDQFELTVDQMREANESTLVKHFG